MLSPGGIDTPFNHGNWNPDRKKKSRKDSEDEKKGKGKPSKEHVDAGTASVLGNLAHLLSNVAQDSPTDTPPSHPHHK